MFDLSKVPPLSRGEHAPDDGRMCIMEAVAHMAGEPWSDSPKCACRVISSLLRTWNDDLPDDQRDVLLRPLIPYLLNTRSTRSVEKRRAIMASDWLIRSYTPAWLRLAGLATHADALESLPEITDFGKCPSLMPILSAAQKDVAQSATQSEPWSAAESAAWGAAWGAAWSVKRSAARSAAENVARSVARSAIRKALRSALLPTVQQLQQSAIVLVHRMIAVEKA